MPLQFHFHSSMLTYQEHSGHTALASSLGADSASEEGGVVRHLESKGRAVSAVRSGERDSEGTPNSAPWTEEATLHFRGRESDSEVSGITMARVD
ncbi:hypothetical protein AAFF_G00248180 [Aldrovandia affinis]|uniref:Uncharacterized protein n=1 Tax=Aldrovandia affinis TaxID=143900 RepID=A0AAD7RG20_9TELE|nr:hypothetical protein AAFF_G00248180 [Aldrovandia affinis]